MLSSSPSLSLRDLQAFDPRAQEVILGQGSEKRLLCPLCGVSKPRDIAHACLSLNTLTGVWRCHRCKFGGKLREMPDERPVRSRRERAQAALARTFAPALPVTANVALAEGQPKSKGWKHTIQGMEPLEGTQGATYLASRGLSVETAQEAGTRFLRDFMGRPAVMFPLRDYDDVLRGAQGRYVDGRDTPKTRSVGEKKCSLFLTRDAFNPELPALIVTEAPLDALSLAEAGYPALALCGTEAPTWLYRAAAFRRAVLLAFDADEAGDTAAWRLAPLLESFGARCKRLRPEGTKDWNAYLQEQGIAQLSDWLACRVLI